MTFVVGYESESDPTVPFIRGKPSIKQCYRNDPLSPSRAARGTALTFISIIAT